MKRAFKLMSNSQRFWNLIAIITLLIIDYFLFNLREPSWFILFNITLGILGFILFVSSELDFNPEYYMWIYISFYGIAYLTIKILKFISEILIKVINKFNNIIDNPSDINIKFKYKSKPKKIKETEFESINNIYTTRF